MQKGKTTIKHIQLVLIVFWLVLGTTIPGIAQSVCSHVDIEWVSRNIPLPDDSQMVLKREKEHLCEVILRVEGGLVPIYAGKTFILAGQLFKGGQSITRDSMATLPDRIKNKPNKTNTDATLEKKRLGFFFKENLKTLEALVSLSFKPEQATGSIYVITDPACPHCKNLLPKLKSAALESRMEIKVIVFPVLGKKSQDMAAHAICNAYSFQDYTRRKITETGNSCDQADQLLTKTELFFQSAGLSFVPLVVAGDGSWMVDTNDITRIRAHLGIAYQKGDTQSGEVCNSDQTQ